jgi:hypothetical protein
VQVMYGAFARKIPNFCSMRDQPWGAGSFHFLKLCIVRTQSMCRTCLSLRVVRIAQTAFFD